MFKEIDKDSMDHSAKGVMNRDDNGFVEDRSVADSLKHGTWSESNDNDLFQVPTSLSALERRAYRLISRRNIQAAKRYTKDFVAVWQMLGVHEALTHYSLDDGLKKFQKKGEI
eukprot:10614855-Ditylum_brightwellii.AAC.1